MHGLLYVEKPVMHACAFMQDPGIPRDPADPAWCMHASACVI
eukprot:SAG11_NODE_8387_length_1021_cov_3.775488_1_plen_41_part_01